MTFSVTHKRRTLKLSFAMMAAFLLAVLVASAAFSAVLADPPDPQAVRDCIAKLPNSTPDKNKDCNEILACVNGKRNNEECCRKEGVDLSGQYVWLEANLSISKEA